MICLQGWLVWHPATGLKMWELIRLPMAWKVNNWFPKQEQGMFGLMATI
jgi:hypothetical protein